MCHDKRGGRESVNIDNRGEHGKERKRVNKKRICTAVLLENVQLVNTAVPVLYIAPPCRDTIEVCIC